jgi:hypothetical protein
VSKPSLEVLSLHGNDMRIRHQMVSKNLKLKKRVLLVR